MVRALRVKAPLAAPLRQLFLAVRVAVVPPLRAQMPWHSTAVASRPVETAAQVLHRASRVPRSLTREAVVVVERERLAAVAVLVVVVRAAMVRLRRRFRR
jgi:hypothetical protein